MIVGVACAGGDSAVGTPGAPTPSSGGSATGTGSVTGDEADDDDDDIGTSTGEPDEFTSTTSEPASTSGGAQSETGAESTGGETGDAGICMPANTCATAMIIGGVAGDESSPNVTHSGTTPTWLGAEVSENNASAFGEELTVTITLESVGGDFDLRAYRGSSGGSSGCNGNEKSSELVGMPDSVRFSFGEGAVANNDDDGAPIAIEVVAKDDICVPGASWTLTVAGDT